jgi:hypothetical protein
MLVVSGAQLDALPLRPYPELSGGSRVGDLIGPDPLENYVWKKPAAGYQIFDDLPIEVVGQPASSFDGLDSLKTAHPNVSVLGPGVLRLKFQQEGASWVSFDSPNADLNISTVTMSISENRRRAPDESATPVAHAGAESGLKTYRLELNAQLYEGVRYAWIDIKNNTSPVGGEAFKQWSITGLRRTNQVVPTNYDGSFKCSDSQLQKLWYTGAYTTRATFTVEKGEVFLGSILMSRGDRIAFLGDAYVAQATALAAFGRSGYQICKTSLNYTKAINNNIQPYWIMWVLSVIDYYDQSADVPALAYFSPWIEKRLAYARDVLMPATATFSAPLRWSRDDDRVGFGFEFPDIPHAQYAYRALVVEACSRYSTALEQGLKNSTGAAEWRTLAEKYKSQIRSEGTAASEGATASESAASSGEGGVSSSEWYAAWGMHASADAINANVTTAAEEAAMLKDPSVFGDPLQLPSLRCHTVLCCAVLYSYCTHTVLILYSYCTHTVLILYSYCTHTVLILPPSQSV